MTVTYQVTDIKHGICNTIEIELPRGWEHASGDDFGDIVEVSIWTQKQKTETEVSSLPEDADMAETSYVTVEYDAYGRDRDQHCDCGHQRQYGYGHG